MLLADSVTRDKALQLSGVNILFLAPEYYEGDDCDYKIDVWSIGAILYLLVTGGVRENRGIDHEESWDFREPIWYSLKEYLLNFMKRLM